MRYLGDVLYLYFKSAIINDRRDNKQGVPEPRPSLIVLTA